MSGGSFRELAKVYVYFARYAGLSPSEIDKFSLEFGWLLFEELSDIIKSESGTTMNPQGRGSF